MRAAALGLRVILLVAATDARRVVPSLLQDESVGGGDDARGGMPNRSTIDASALAAEVKRQRDEAERAERKRKRDQETLARFGFGR